MLTSPGMEMILIGPIGHVDRVGEQIDAFSNAIEYKGFRLLARAKRGPVGWIGELMILLPQNDAPIHAWVPVHRFHTEPSSAINASITEGMIRIDQGRIIQL
jgi:hypothetical protein